MIETHWSERFLRFGYRRGATGPDLFDCWSFFRLVQREQFGRDVPFHPSPHGLRAIAAAMPDWAAEFGWRSTEAPETGDAVFMSFWRHPTHVGVYVADLREASVLHCPEGGAALHSLSSLEMARWKVRALYRFVGVS